jgi:hypothetical protein
MGNTFVDLAMFFGFVVFVGLVTGLKRGLCIEDAEQQSAEEIDFEIAAAFSEARDTVMVCADRCPGETVARMCDAVAQQGETVVSLSDQSRLVSTPPVPSRASVAAPLRRAVNGSKVLSLVGKQPRFSFILSAVNESYSNIAAAMRPTRKPQHHIKGGKKGTCGDDTQAPHHRGGLCLGLCATPAWPSCARTGCLVRVFPSPTVFQAAGSSVMMDDFIYSEPEALT